MRKKISVEIAKLIPRPVWKIFKTFTENGYEIYLVGGGVRNLLSEKIPVNCDFTTNAIPEIIQSLFEESFYDNIYGTVGINFETPKGKEIYEITTYRSERGYSDKRRPDKIKWEKKLEKDLERREFTISAMVIGPSIFAGGRIRQGKPASSWDGKTLELIDLFDGQNDFKNKIIRAVGDADTRFSEDALRMMRAIRLSSQLGFQIESKTFQAMQQNATSINQISAERIRDEFFKILKSDYPVDGYLILRNAGLAKEILPEVEKMFGVEQKSPGRHHLDDVGTHAVKSLNSSNSNDPLVKLAILLHDVGKPLAAGRDEKGIITFYNHEIIGASITRSIGRRLRLSKKDQERLYKLVRWHQFSVDERQTDKAVRRFIRNVGRENLADILEVRRADRLGGGALETSWRLERFKQKLTEVQKQPFTAADLKIDGHDVMKILKIDPGPMVGKILEQLFEEVEKEKIKNKREELLEKIKKIQLSSYK